MTARQIQINEQIELGQELIQELVELEAGNLPPEEKNAQREELERSLAIVNERLEALGRPKLMALPTE